MAVIRLAATIRDDENALLSGVVGTPLKTGTTTSAGSPATSGADGLVAITSTIAEAVDLRLFNDPVYWTWNATDEVQLKTLQTWNADADEYTASFVRAEDAADQLVEVAEFVATYGGTPIDGDAAYISLKLSDSAGNQDEGARITWKATTVLTGATQDTDLILSALVNNTLTTFLTLDGSASQLVPAVGINAAGVTSPDLGTVQTVAITGGTITGITDITVADGGTGRSTSTTAYALLAAGTTATGAHQTLAAGALTEILVGGGAAALPAWTTATGSGAPVRATSPALVTPALGTPTALVLTAATGLPAAAVLAGSFGAGAYVISTSLQAATIELGHATDTTLARVSAGLVSIEGVNILMNGGALGTPSGGTVTNLTGTASININGTVGATTPAAGAFTSVMAGGQPCFLARNSATDSDVTGDGTVVTVDFDAEVFDVGANFAADTFTAPVTGKYLFTASIQVAGMDGVNHDLSIDVVTSNRSYHVESKNNLVGTISSSFSIIADMDAGDTATIALGVFNGTAVVDIVGAATYQTWWGGYLLAS